jgi:hypothetical protein
MNPTEILTDIADSIRAREQSTALIPVANYAARINAFVVSGTDDRKIFRFSNFLTEQQEQDFNLWRFDGRPIYQATNQSMYNAFKAASLTVGEIPASPNRVFDRFLLVGDKLYVGSSTTALTSILVINTLTGAVKQITGLPSRVYAVFELIGTEIFCSHGDSTTFNSIVVIDTTNDTFSQIGITNASWNSGFRRVGNRLFMMGRGNISYLAWINIDTKTYSTLSLTGSAARSQHIFVAGTKLYIASATGSSLTDFLIPVDTTKIGVAGEQPVLPSITGLPARYHDAFYYAPPYLYVASSRNNENITTIPRINTDNDTYVLIGGETAADPLPRVPLPARLYANGNTFTGVLVGNKVYIGSPSAATSIIVVLNTAAGTWKEIPDMPNRNYEISSVGNGFGHYAYGTPVSKLYLGQNGSHNTLVVIDTVMDSFSEIASLQSRAYTRFLLNGNILYCLSTTSASNIQLVNTDSDVSGGTITGLTSRAYNIPMEADGKLYIGAAAATTIPVINLATNTLIEQITGLPAAGRGLTGGSAAALLLYAHGKIYLGGMGSNPSMLVLSDSVLPKHALPIYIKPSASGAPW